MANLFNGYILLMLYVHSMVNADNCSYPGEFHGTWLFRNNDMEFIMKIHPEKYEDIIEMPNGEIVTEGGDCQYNSQIIDSWLYFVHPGSATSEPSCVRVKHTTNALIVYDQHVELGSNTQSGGNPEGVRCDTGHLDVAILLDISQFPNTISAQNAWKAMIDFTTALTDQIKLTANGIVKIGFITFSDKIHQTINLNQYNSTQSLLKTINSLNFNNSGMMSDKRNTSGALRYSNTLFSTKNGGRDYAPNIAILLVHGISNLDADRTIPDAFNLRSSDSRIFTVAIDPVSDPYEYKYMSSTPNKLNDSYWILNQFNELPNLAPLIVYKICTNYVYNPATNLNPTTCAKLKFHPPALVFYRHPIEKIYACEFARPDTYQVTIKGTQVLCGQQQNSIVTVLSNKLYFNTCAKDWPLQNMDLWCIGHVVPSDIGDENRADKIQILYRHGGKYGHHYCYRYQQLPNGQISIEIDTSGHAAESCTHGYMQSSANKYNVTLTPIPKAPSTFNFSITNITPNKGIVAGGAQVTVTGMFGSTPSNIGFKNKDDTIFLDIQSRTSGSIIAKTKRNMNAAGGTYKLQMVLPGNRIVPSDVNFTYTPDPVITDIYPRDTILSGGVNVTIIGQNFAAVDKTTFYIDMETRRPDGNSYTVVGVTSFESKDVLRVGDKELVFRTPAITLPAQNVVPGRRKRSGHGNDPVVNNQNLQFFAGVKFDNSQKYINLSQTIGSKGVVTVYADPNFESFKKTYMFDIRKDKYIQIKGSNLAVGSSVNIYTLNLGSDICEVADVTDNELYCRPPNVQPSSNAEEYGLPTLMITAGNLKFRVGYVEYYERTEVLYMVLAVVASAVLVLCMIWCTLTVNMVQKKARDIEKYKQTNVS